MNKIKVELVHGNSGYSLQMVNKEGTGIRIAGEKAWGNPYNIPTASFEIDVDELIKTIKSYQYTI